MEHIRTTQVKEYVGQQVTLAGWVHQMRALGGITFLVIRDGFGTVQAVTEDPAAVAPLLGLQTETVITLTGTVVAEAQAPGGLELHDLDGRGDHPGDRATAFPDQQARAQGGAGHLPRQRHRGAAEPRLPGALPPISGNYGRLPRGPGRRGLHRDPVAQADRQRHRERSQRLPGRILRQPAYLAQSPQFYKQIMVGVFERVFEVGPVFRAEPHSTSRHINEYVSLDAEMGFIENHFTVMRVLTEVIRHIVTTLRSALRR